MPHKYDREPIEHTCPDIDRTIKYIKMVMMKDRDLKNLNESELFDAASAMNSELDGCIDFLEQMRKSNDTLRQWGIEEATRVDELEFELEEVKAQTIIGLPK